MVPAIPFLLITWHWLWLFLPGTVGTLLFAGTLSRSLGLRVHQFADSDEDVLCEGFARRAEVVR